MVLEIRRLLGRGPCLQVLMKSLEATFLSLPSLAEKMLAGLELLVRVTAAMASWSQQVPLSPLSLLLAPVMLLLCRHDNSWSAGTVTSSRPPLIP